MAEGMASQTLGDHPAAPVPEPEEIAGKFPQFEILECLGRGGMGVVYKARQKSLNRLVAIKILAPERKHDARFAERFAREAELLAKLSHPHIVTIHDFGETGGLYYLVMEFVDGVSLRDLLREGKLEPAQALTIVPEICDALQFAHDQGIVHRDIKPENIMLDRRGRVKVADFGLAKLVGSANDQASDSEPASPELTEVGKIMGTPSYMAPEQTRHPGNVDHRADIYALGVVFYQMLTGELPKGDFAPPSKKVIVDVRLDEVVLRALEKNPELRYQQVSLLKTQVETIAGDLGSTRAPRVVSGTPAGSIPTQSVEAASQSGAGSVGNEASSAQKDLHFFDFTIGMPQTVERNGRQRFYWPGVLLFCSTIGFVVCAVNLSFVLAIWLLNLKLPHGNTFINPGELWVWFAWLAFCAIGRLASLTLGADKVVRANYPMSKFTIIVVSTAASVVWAFGFLQLAGWLRGASTTALTGDSSRIAAWIVISIALGWFIIRRFRPKEKSSADAGAKAFEGLSVREFRSGIDLGNYGQSWEAAAPMFQRTLGKAEWVSEMENVRRPLGKAIGGEIRSVKFAPDRSYFDSVFHIVFDSQRAAEESMTCAMHPDGEYKVISYHIKPVDCEPVGMPTGAECKSEAFQKPCFSRSAIHGATVAGVLIIASGFLIPVVQLPLDPIDAVLVLVLAIFGTVAGWHAVFEIRRSSWKLRGMGLAVFGGLLFPLLALDNVLLGCQLAVYGYINGNASPMPVDTFAFFLMLLVLVAVDWFVIRWVWHTVNKTTAAEPVLLPAVETWLSVMDNGDYAGSWEAAAPMFQAVAGKAEWIGRCEKVRRPLGGIVSRRMKSGRVTGFGKLFKAEFATVFDSGLSATETVTFSRQSDGGWKALTYIIRADKDLVCDWKMVFWIMLGALLLITTIMVLVGGGLIGANRNGTKNVSSGPVVERAVKNPPFVARLNQGEVELLAVGNQPWSDTACWLPNGAPSSKPFPMEGGSIDNWAKGRVQKKLAFQIHCESANGPISRPVCRFNKGLGFSGESSSTQRHGPRESDTSFIQLVACPPDARTMNFSLGVAGGPWETATTLGRDGSVSNDEWSASVNAVPGKSDEMVVTCLYSVNEDWESRMVYVNGEGKVIPIEDNRTQSIAGQTIATLLASSDEFARIKEFQLQRRRYQWVEFRDVSLLPGHRTQVKVVETMKAPVGRIQQTNTASILLKPKVVTDQNIVEDLALQMIVAIREKDDVKLKLLATDRIKGWRDALPVFAIEGREHYRQMTSDEKFDMRVSESLVDGNLAVVKCIGPKELNGIYLVLFFLKTDAGWLNYLLRNSPSTIPLSEHLANFKEELQKEGNAADTSKPVVSVAEKWLVEIDTGNYSQSWKDASALFQAAITKDGWNAALTNVRKPLGALVSRKLKSSQATKSLPGAPDGEYVVMQFDTSFAAKKIAVETVTFMLEKDDSWRAAGYFIR